MFHPLIRLLVSRPDLVIHHAGAYASLAALQAEDAVLNLRRRAMLAAVAAVSGLVGAALGGGALLLLAVIPIRDMPAPWLLAAAPGVPLLLALVLVLKLRRQPWSWSMAALREQFAADAQLLSRASAE